MEQEKYTVNCKTCSAEFESDSPYRKYCDSCRKLRNKKARQRYHRLHSNSESEEKVKWRKRPNLAQKIEEIRKQELHKVRYDIDCPNYDPTKVECAYCSSESYKYKDCGEKK